MEVRTKNKKRVDLFNRTYVLCGFVYVNIFTNLQKHHHHHRRRRHDFPPPWPIPPSDGGTVHIIPLPVWIKTHATMR